jgi:hypothetical protein
MAPTLLTPAAAEPAGAAKAETTRAAAEAAGTTGAEATESWTAGAAEKSTRHVSSFPYLNINLLDTTACGNVNQIDGWVC